MIASLRNIEEPERPIAAVRGFDHQTPGLMAIEDGKQLRPSCWLVEETERPRRR
jgi:hypothetical protein